MSGPVVSTIAFVACVAVFVVIVSAAILWHDRHGQRLDERQRERAYRLALRQRTWERVKHLDQEWM